MTKRPQVELIIPIHNMTSPSCAVRVEAALKQLPGVMEAGIDLASGKARVVYNPDQVDGLDFQYAVREAGYEASEAEVVFEVRGMTCISCAAHIEGALLDLPGVIQAEVKLRLGSAYVRFIPGGVTFAQMKQAVGEIGYEAFEPPGYSS